MSGVEEERFWTATMRDTQEKLVNMWYSNLAFSNVKHKKQSCRAVGHVGRLSHELLFLFMASV